MSKPKLKSRAGAKPELKASAKPGESAAAPNRSIMESAQQIWMAGLGAFSKAQEGGSKLFETLIKEGLTLEQKTRKLATGKVDDVRSVVEGSVSQVRERTQETWDRLEQVFESRVSRALNKLGIPGRKDLDELLKRVDELGTEVRKLNPMAAKSPMNRAVTNSMRRAKDDLSDLVKDIEDAQLAAKQATKRTVASVHKAAKKVAKNAGKKRK